MRVIWWSVGLVILFAYQVYVSVETRSQDRDPFFCEPMDRLFGVVVAVAWPVVPPVLAAHYAVILFIDASRWVAKRVDESPVCAAPVEHVPGVDPYRKPPPYCPQCHQRLK